MNPSSTHKPLLPGDPNDARLAALTHPPDWVNPAPAPRYDLVVLGAGTAGLVSAAGAAFLGARVAMVERSFTGGDCLVTGCVPSKALIRSARAAFDTADAGRFGVRLPGANGPAEVDFPAVMRRVRAVRADVGPHDAAAEFRDQWGVDVFFGDARFVAPDAVEVTNPDGAHGSPGPVRLQLRRAVVATGSRPAVPDVPGLREAGFLTNETVFNLTERPDRLAVIGGGPLGCELAQALARLGSRVTLVQHGPRLLPRDDEEAGELLHRALSREGIDVRLGTTLRRVTPTAGRVKALTLQGPGGESGLDADAILVAAGRSPNVEGLGLEIAGVRLGPAGVAVNDFLRTSNPRIYAAGDVCLPYRFTHTADASARLAIQNALLPVRKRFSRLVVPWCTYTDPEIAHVGLDERQARDEGWKVRTVRVPLDRIDRAMADGETEGFLKIHLKAGTDRILGATLVSRHAGESISQVTTAIVGDIGLKKLAQVIFPYPTQAEVIRAAADEFYGEGIGPLLRGLLRRWVRRET